jgi:hypothetical protein
MAFAPLAGVRAARGAIVVFVTTISLASCGARSALTVGAGGSAGPQPKDDAGDVSVEAASLDAPVAEPCATAPALVDGQPVSGTTCDAVNPAGSTCGTQPTAFYRFELPPQSDVPLHLSANLSWGVLCECPERAVCCVGPSGFTASQGYDTSLANMGSTPRSGVLAISRRDEGCGDYTVSLGP